MYTEVETRHSNNKTLLIYIQQENNYLIRKLACVVHLVIICKIGGEAYYMHFEGLYDRLK